MGRVADDPIRRWCPDFADVNLGRDPAKGLLTASEIVGGLVDAIVGQAGMDLMSHGLKHVLKDLRRGTPVDLPPGSSLSLM